MDGRGYKYRDGAVRWEEERRKEGKKERRKEGKRKGARF